VRSCAHSVANKLFFFKWNSEVKFGKFMKKDLSGMNIKNVYEY